MKQESISIVIPAYNEEKVIYSTLQKVSDYFLTLGKRYEIVVSDDGSTDRTSEIVKSTEIPYLKSINSPINRGKGMAVKLGVMASKGDYVLLTDADLSAPIEEFRNLFNHKARDVVIGSRALKSSEVVSSVRRIVFGRIGHLFISCLTVKGIKDTQCGFKLFKGAIAKHLFSLQRLKRYGFDFEILFLAQKYGYSTKEIPVKWILAENSKIKPMDYLYTLLELLQVRYYFLRGEYERNDIKDP